MPKPILFIDRDGTLIEEPPVDLQVDSLEKLIFVPGVFYAMKRIADSKKFHLVMVTNQDGLGTQSFPENTFWPAHNKMLQAFANEGIVFDAIHIDRSFEHEGLPTRKPGIGMLQEYLIKGAYDIANSFVIGDRRTDAILAKNLGCKAIVCKENIDASDLPMALQSTSWYEIADFLLTQPRKSTIHRVTNETKILVELNIDGNGECHIHTGLGFFDHMLEQLGKHSSCDLKIEVNGDLHIDEHHTVEDTAIAIGDAFSKALGDKRGIERYGFLLPMDDCLAQAAIDFSGRPWLVWDAEFHRENIGDMPTEMFYHFWKSFSDAAKCNLNIKAEGQNEHHKIEAIFKSVAKSIKMAVRKTAGNQIPSTKGVL